MSTEVYSDGYFAVVPEWVLDADISAQAVRLYAVLRRYADQHSGQAFPSRRTLAVRLHVASTRTVDAALEDLLRIGAVEVSAQIRDDGGNGTSRYLVRGVQKVSDMQKVRTPVQQTAQGYAADYAPPVQQTAQAPMQQTAPLEPEPLEPKPKNQTPAPAERRGDRQTTATTKDSRQKILGSRAAALTREHVDACGGMANYLAVQGIVKRALDVPASGGGSSAATGAPPRYSDEQVRKALAELRSAGRPITLQTMQATLDAAKRADETTRVLTHQQADAILGPDTWRVPKPPPGLRGDDLADWIDQQKAAHRRDRIAHAIARQTGATA